ncbi:hypothetical protein BU17DRAFT_61812 [Hysterangium stoloniferum]|nr:hypothetical protein BU17DRAFT_61812 [Hysterangium stoloniferum]
MNLHFITKPPTTETFWLLETLLMVTLYDAYNKLNAANKHARPPNSIDHKRTGKTSSATGMKRIRGTNSAKNLFYIEYLKTHYPVMPATFECIWKALGKEKIKKWIIFSKSLREASNQVSSCSRDRECADRRLQLPYRCGLNFHITTSCLDQNVKRDRKGFHGYIQYVYGDEGSAVLSDMTCYAGILYDGVTGNMPTSLLDLPEEILEACGGYVALDNPHFYVFDGSSDIFDTEVVFCPPRDILHFRLACRKLRRICEPRIWAAINLNYDDREPGRANRVAGWRYYTTENKSNYIRHVRALSIAYYHMDKVQEQDVEVEVLSLLPLVTQAKNLRLLRVYIPDVSKSPDMDADCNKIVNALLRQPLLHTVIIRDTFPLQLLPLAPTNILNLRINNYHAFFSLLPFTPHLQALAIPGSNYPLSFPSSISLSILLPWGTLRELEIYDGFADIVNNLLDQLKTEHQCWKNIYQDRHAPLKEVSFYGAVVGSTQIAQFLQIFEGIPLTTLYLESLNFIDDVVLSDLVDTFPKLQRLIILSEDLNMEWDFTLEELVRRFSNLQDLEYLGWDYSSFLTDLTSVRETANEEDGMRMTSRAIVPIMALACPRLQVVEHFYPEFSHIFSIKRDNEGDVDHVDWRCSRASLYGPTIQTSFWVQCLQTLSHIIASARLVMFGISH